MRNIEIRPDGATVELTLHELVILKNAINETLNELSANDISARVGAKTSEVETLFSQVHETIGKVDEASAAQRQSWPEQ
jgi:hypothetical protein